MWNRMKKGSSIMSMMLMGNGNETTPYEIARDLCEFALSCQECNYLAREHPFSTRTIKTVFGWRSTDLMRILE